MKCTEIELKIVGPTHLYGIHRTMLIKTIHLFFKICKISSGKMLTAVIKCTENRAVKSYSFL